MSEALSRHPELALATPLERLQLARSVVTAEADALLKLSKNLPDDFTAVVDLILDGEGAVIVTGIGKAGWIGQKLSASFASTGSRSHFLHPAEAFHGDLGRIGADDVVLVLSNSGETSEVLQLIPSIKSFGTPLIAMTGNARSTLARQADLILDYGQTPEAGHLGLAPSTSTAVMLALGDALALVVSRARQFREIDFARFHPGGSLGRKLSLVEEVMRPLDQCRMARESESIREVYVRHGGRDRRVGVILIVNQEGELSGLFTDSDLARMLERAEENKFDRPISELMTRHPVTVAAGSRAALAIEMLACRNLSELPVVDGRNRPLGLIDITDIVNI